MRFFASHTWLLFLIPLVGVLLLSHYTSRPWNLLADTDVDYIDKDTVLGVQLVDEGQERQKTIRYLAQAEDHSQFYLYLYKDSLPFPHMGDWLVVSTCVKRGEKIGDFDYGRYLRRKGIVGSAFAYRRNWTVVGHEEKKDLRSVAARVQGLLHGRLAAMGVKGDDLAVLSALTLGYRHELSPHVRESFSRAGAMHVLAVSGLHTGMVWGMLLFILSLGGRINPSYEQYGARWIMGIIGLIALWSYAGITGFCPSVVRSALMLSIAHVGWLTRRPQASLNILCAAAVMILLIDPLYLWDVGFQLSFAAVLALVVLLPRWQKRIAISNGGVHRLVDLLLVSVAAQLGTMPLTMYYFGQTSNYFALTNVLVIPLAGLIVPCTLLALLFSACPLGPILAQIAGFLTSVMRLGVERVESLPGAVTPMSIHAESVLLLYAAIGMSVMMMRGEKVHVGWLVGVVACLACVVGIEMVKG